jgi:predicted ATPase
MPTPLPRPSLSPAGPRSSPEMSPPSAPTATIAWRSRVNTAFPLWAANGRILQGWADAQQGEVTTGIARIRDGLAATEATGTRIAIPFYLALLAEALALAGKIEEGLATLDDALAKAAVSGVRGWDAEIHRLRGELTGRLPYPDPAKAEDSFRAALAIAREQGTRGYELAVEKEAAGRSSARFCRGSLGLTRFGGHPESLARGAADAKNTSTVYDNAMAET